MTRIIPYGWCLCPFDLNHVKSEEMNLKGSNRRKNNKQFTEDSAHTRSIFISVVSLRVTQSSMRVNVAANFVDNERVQVNVLDSSIINS